MSSNNREGKIIAITYGTYDLFHFGHSELFRRIKDISDYLIVAVSSDEFNASKGKEAHDSFEVRKANVLACEYVDEVISEDGWDQKSIDVQNNNIDIFVMGDDWKGKFDFLEEHCKVVYLDRTKGISSTMLREEKNK